MNILHIDSSVLGDNSASRGLTAEVVSRLKRSGADVRYLDLAANPFPHFTMATLGALMTPAEQRTPEQQAEAALSDKAVDDLFWADTVVIGVPMYNFSIPSQLKTWIDRITMAGRTFRYTANGPEGLAGGRTVILVSTRGGLYGAASGAAHMEHQTSYLKSVLGFLGVTDIRIVEAEGLKVSPESAQAAIAAAIAGLDETLRLAEAA